MLKPTTANLAKELHNQMYSCTGVSLLPRRICTRTKFIVVLVLVLMIRFRLSKILSVILKIKTNKKPNCNSLNNTPDLTSLLTHNTTPSQKCKELSQGRTHQKICEIKYTPPFELPLLKAPLTFRI